MNQGAVFIAGERRGKGAERTGVMRGRGEKQIIRVNKDTVWCGREGERGREKVGRGKEERGEERKSSGYE